MATPYPFRGACAGEDDRRSHPRVEVALPAFVHADGGRHAVQLLDLSRGGARLKVNTSFPVGSTVMLDCGTLGRAGVIRWQNGDFVGLCFNLELDDREIATQIERSKALAARIRHANGS